MVQSLAGSSTAGLAASAPASRALRWSSTHRILKQASSQHSAYFCHHLHVLTVMLLHVWVVQRVCNFIVEMLAD